MSRLVEVEGLKKYFPMREGIFAKEKDVVRAVDEVSFTIDEGETLALVGESGCGKTTLGRLLLRLLEPTSGTVRFQGANIFELDRKVMQELRREMQIIFQDPIASLNPRKTVRHILSQPYTLHDTVGRDELETKVFELLELVGLTPPHLYVDRYPQEFSGGQRQRIGIARAMALRPRFIVADEPVSALDVSVRAQILNLMSSLQEKFGLTYLFTTHDLAVVRSVSRRVAVMYLGKFVELAEVNELYNCPLHPYTKALFSATPVPDPKRTRSRRKIILAGDVPSPINPPAGCRFNTRCTHAREICKKTDPPLEELRDGHLVACHLVRVAI